MTRLVFLLEEASMKEVLKVILPKVLPESICFILIPHEGKSDLEKSIPRKLRAWRDPATRFVVVRDADSADCRLVKKRLYKLCEEAGRPDALIRIVCKELESWFLGDLSAVEKAFSAKGISTRQDQKKFRIPDDLSNAKQELKRIVPRYQPLKGARAISRHMSLKENRSRSFQVFLEGVAKVLQEPSPTASRR
jgi:hypothetical protein